MNTHTLSNIKYILESAFTGLDLEINTDLSFGTFSSKIAFKQAKTKGVNPAQLAQDIAHTIDEYAKAHSLLITVSTKGPFINITPTHSFYVSYIQDEFCISSTQKQNNTSLTLEYISPNIAKPLHAAHLLQGNYAQALKNILSVSYPHISTNCFMGDWGINTGMTVWGYKQRVGKETTVTINGKEEVFTVHEGFNSIETLVRLYIWANQQKEQVPHFDELVRIEHKKLEDGDSENLSIWKQFHQSTLTNLESLLDELNIDHFDSYNGEYHALSMVTRLDAFLQKHTIGTVEGAGRYIQFEELTDWDQEEKHKKQCGRAYLYESNTGYTTYILRDVAAKIQYAASGTDTLITFVGSEQVHNFRQVYALCDYLSKHPAFIAEFGETIAQRISYKNQIGIYNGMVSLPEGKMSTRKGNFVTASQILKTLYNELDNNPDISYTKDEIHTLANASLKWFHLQKDITSNSVFIPSEVTQFTGNTGIYMLYTYARLKSILRKNAYTPTPPSLDVLSHLSPVEYGIMQKISLSPLIIGQVQAQFKVHIFVQYLFELAGMINSWYTHTPVSTEQDHERKKALLYFTAYVADVLKKHLSLLNIETLESM